MKGPLRTAHARAKDALILVRAIPNDIKRGDRIDALDMIRLAQNELAACARLLRSSLKKDGLR